MKNDAKADYIQFTILTTLFTVGTSILITPSSLAQALNQDAWLVPFFSIIPAVIFLGVYKWLFNHQPNKTIVEKMQEILGSWFGTCLSILFIITAFLAAAMVLYDVSRFIKTVFMPETSVIFINSLFTLLLVYGLMSGFNTLVRMVQIMFPFCVLLFVMMVIALIPEIKIQNIQPIFEAPLYKYTYSTLSLASIVYFPLIFFLMLQPKELQHPKNSFKSFIVGVFIGSLINASIILLNILVVGSNVTSIQEYPAYHLAQKIEIGGFITRVEVVIALIWLLTSFVKLLVYFHSAFLGFTQILNIKHKKSFVIPMAFLLIVISVDIFPNSIYENKFNATVWIGWITTFAIGLPVLLIVVGVLKKRIKGK